MSRKKKKKKGGGGNGNGKLVCVDHGDWKRIYRWTPSQPSMGQLSTPSSGWFGSGWSSVLSVLRSSPRTPAVAAPLSEIDPTCRKSDEDNPDPDTEEFTAEEITEIAEIEAQIEAASTEEIAAVPLPTTTPTPAKPRKPWLTKWWQEWFGGEG